MHLLTISRYAIPEEEDQTLDTNVSKSLKEIETPEEVHVFLSDDEGSNLTLGEEDDDGWIVASDEESVLEKHSDDPSINVSRFEWRFLTC